MQPDSQDGGNRVTVVARGQRLADIRRYGLALENIVGHGQSTTQVDTTERLGPDDQYDIALIAVRRDQVASVLPELTANHRIPTMIFMLNNPTGAQATLLKPSAAIGFCSVFPERGAREKATSCATQ